MMLARKLARVEGATSWRSPGNWA